MTSVPDDPQVADGLCANPEKTDNIVIQQTSHHKKGKVGFLSLYRETKVSIVPNRKDMWVINEFQPHYYTQTIREIILRCKRMMM